MKNFPLSTFIDTLVTVILGFLFTFLIFNYFIQRPYSYIIALSIGIMLAVATYKVSINKFRKRLVTKSESQQIQAVLNQLDFLSVAELTALFTKAFMDDKKKVEKKRGYLYLTESKTAVFLSFGFNAKTKAEIVKAYNILCDKDKDISKAILIGSEFPKEIIEFALRFGGKISLIYGDTVYRLLAKNNNLPSITCEILKTENKKPNWFISLCNKKNSRKFLLFGSVFLLTSYFVPIKIYYLIFGGIMLTFGFILMIFGKYNEE